MKNFKLLPLILAVLFSAPQAFASYNPNNPNGGALGSNSAPVVLSAPVLSAAQIQTRPNDTTTYTTGDLIGNSTVAASITPWQFAIAPANGVPVYLTGAIVKYRNVTATPTGTTATSTSVTSVSSLSGVAVGNSITSSTGDIPDGTYITAAAGSTITLSQAATGSNSGETLTIGAGVATTATSFLMHTYGATPSTTVGDNGVAAGALSGSWCGDLTVQLTDQGLDWTTGVAVPRYGPYIACTPLSGSTTIYGLMEAAAGFIPTASGQFYWRTVNQ